MQLLGILPRAFLLLGFLVAQYATGRELSDVDRDWWSLRAIQERPLPPAVDNESYGNPIDRFINFRRQSAGLKPAKRADARTMIRRLSLVITGLPPSRAEVGSFLADCQNLGWHLAYEQLVDRLMASPHLGESWARHWMDVVRFSETHGNEWNYEVHHAWRFRDYLIRAFNEDLPFDQMVREQIAGDLLESPRWSVDGYNESLIGTAFYRFGEANHDDCVNLRTIGFDIADNQIDTLTKAFQATTVACARCHDHKLDPITMRDYYGLLGIIRSSRLVARVIDAPDRNAASVRLLRQAKTSIHGRLARVWLKESLQIGAYLIAAQAAKDGLPNASRLAKDLDQGRLERWTSLLSAKETPWEDPISIWAKLTDEIQSTGPANETDDVARTWSQLVAEFRAQQRSRRQFNTGNFITLADFRTGVPDDWQRSGVWLEQKVTRRGTLILSPQGDDVVQSVVPSGFYTHIDSSKLNGSLRSPVLLPTWKRVSFQVMGQRASAIRLVSNNCQLNYANYRALTSDDFRWVTFEIPREAESLRTYAELITMLANPKYPDQLGTLGGDKQDYRIPWHEAIANPRSWFGLTQAVIHDIESPPKPDLSHLDLLLDDIPPLHTPQSLANVAGRYSQVIWDAIESWSNMRASDAQVEWIRWLLKHQLLSNSIQVDTELADLVATYRKIEADQISVPRFVPSIADDGQGYDQPILDRGDCLRPLEPVSRQYLEVLDAGKASFHVSQGSGRLELANHIASADSPLTSRVFVNRVWHHLFGTGIVSTVDDFGHMGEPPSHPGLLDYLAIRFVRDHWSLKRLLRLVVTSDTFQMASTADEVGRRLDPTNRLLHHYPIRRLSAESIRDSILAVSGRIDGRQFGTSIAPYRNKDYPDRRLFAGPLDGQGRRSVYIKVNLMEPPNFLGLFNTPGGKLVEGRRDESNVPAQALAMLNDPFVFQQAGVWADHLVDDTFNGEQRIRLMFEQSLGRLPDKEELHRYRQLIAKLADLYSVDEEDVLKEHVLWRDLAHTFFNMKEFIYIY